MTRVSVVAVLLVLAPSALAFVPHAVPFKAVRQAAPVELNAEPITHQDYKCDSCGMDPIVGPRFECTNVEGNDLCSQCAMLPGQAFSAGGKSFEELRWKIISGPNTSGASPSAAPDSVGQPNDLYAHESLAPRAARTAAPAPAKVDETYSITDSGPASNPDGTYKYDRAGGSRYSSFAPDANDYNDDKEFRAAMKKNLEKDLKARRASGTYGNKATEDYMSSL